MVFDENKFNDFVIGFAKYSDNQLRDIALNEKQKSKQTDYTRTYLKALKKAMYDRGLKKLYEEISNGYTVYVDDNFHYMDQSERITDKTYSTYEEAVERCRDIVDEELKRTYEEGMSAEELYKRYTIFCDDPFIVPRKKDGFRAWHYAQEQSKILVESKK